MLTQPAAAPAAVTDGQAFFAAPRLAVACPTCQKPAGEWCRSAAGRKLPELHAGRKAPATPAIDTPGVSTAPTVEEPVMASKIQKTTAKNRREPGSRPAAGKPIPTKPDLKVVGKTSATAPTEKKKSKSAIVHDMLTSKTGATRKELSAATDWPSVNLTVAAARADMVLEEDEKTGKCRLVAKPAKK